MEWLNSNQSSGYLFADVTPFSLHIDCRADSDLGWQMEGHSDNDWGKEHQCTKATLVTVASISDTMHPCINTYHLGPQPSSEQWGDQDDSGIRAAPLHWHPGYWRCSLPPPGSFTYYTLDICIIGCEWAPLNHVHVRVPHLWSSSVDLWLHTVKASQNYAMCSGTWLVTPAPQIYSEKYSNDRHLGPKETALSCDCQSQ